LHQYSESETPSYQQNKSRYARASIRSERGHAGSDGMRCAASAVGVGEAEGGVRYDRRHVGTFGNMGLLSYYGSKTITGGEGGGEFPAPIATNILSSNGRSTPNALDMWNFYRLSK
jgi:hypothetical protein